MRGSEAETGESFRGGERGVIQTSGGRGVMRGSEGVSEWCFRGREWSVIQKGRGGVMRKWGSWSRLRRGEQGVIQTGRGRREAVRFYIVAHVDEVEVEVEAYGVTNCICTHPTHVSVTKYYKELELGRGIFKSNRSKTHRRK